MQYILNSYYFSLRASSSQPIKTNIKTKITSQISRLLWRIINQIEGKQKTKKPLVVSSSFCKNGWILFLTVFWRVNKWWLNLVSCNFGLKSYFGFQIKLVLRVCFQFWNHDNHAYHFSLTCSPLIKFNRHYIPLSLITTRHNTLARTILHITKKLIL